MNIWKAVAFLTSDLLDVVATLFLAFGRFFSTLATLASKTADVPAPQEEQFETAHS